MSEPFPAATVMIVRDAAAGIEVLLLQRSPSSAFMPGAFVFPGGRVDAHDGSAAALAAVRGPAPRVDPAHLVAAVRETFEEAGLLFSTAAVTANALAAGRRQLAAREVTFAELLARLDVRIDAPMLYYFSRWITPPQVSRRFDTHFLTARAPVGQVVRADGSEMVDDIWIAPAEALHLHAAGRLALMFPTIKHLERLSAFTHVDALLQYAGAKTIRPVTPHAAGDESFAVPAALEGVW